jgi:excisionase family DNA binding protein
MKKYQSDLATPSIRATSTYIVADDVLNGANEIARFLGISRRSVYHYIENGELPVFRLGSKLCARKSTLIRHIEALEDDKRESNRTGLTLMIDLKKWRESA